MNTSMHHYFDLQDHLNNFLFKGLDITDVTGLILTCIVVFVMTVLLESMKVLQLYYDAKFRQDPLTYGQSDKQTDASIQDRLPLFSSLLIPSSMKQIQRRRLKYRFCGFVAHTINVCIAYFIMLAVMTFNGWIGISVIVGAGFGHFLVGTISYRIAFKYSMLSSVPTLTMSRPTSESEQQLVT
ncbi:hypothetical protein ScPMuIL_010104 [Solemya velum]